mgnify:CR=1 FL=1
MANMKKWICLAAAVLLAFSLAACGGAGTGSDSSASGGAGKTYVIYSDNAFPPYEFLDNATNTYVGIDMDILAAVAKDQNFQYEVKNEGFDASMGAVQAGQADGMIAGMTITDERKQTFDFSEPYFEDGQILVVKGDSSVQSLEDLKGKRIAVKTSTQGAAYAESVKDEYDLELVYYEDSPTMYTAIENGTDDACFEDRMVILYTIGSENLNLKTVGDVINPGSYGFAVKKGTNAALLEMFNKGLANIRASGEYDEILAKYNYQP